LRETMPAAVAPVAFATNRRAVTIGTAAALARDGDGQVWLVRFAQKRRTQIGAGENARRTLDDTNGVESLAALGEWRGGEATFPLEPPAPGEGIAVLVQAADGHILGAAMLLGS